MLIDTITKIFGKIELRGFSNLLLAMFFNYNQICYEFWFIEKIREIAVPISVNLDTHGLSLVWGIHINFKYSSFKYWLFFSWHRHRSFISCQQLEVYFSSWWMRPTVNRLEIDRNAESKSDTLYMYIHTNSGKWHQKIQLQRRLEVAVTSVF